MIVDSPGVGESDVMSEFVLNYLPHAFCFMYVINSNNAGGIQDDRVRAWKVEYFIRINWILSASPYACWHVGSNILRFSPAGSCSSFRMVYPILTTLRK